LLRNFKEECQNDEKSKREQKVIGKKLFRGEKKFVAS